MSHASPRSDSSHFDPTASSNSVSVIIPVYNGEKFIRRTLDSIVGQTVPPAQVLVIDDGSPDESARVSETFGSPIRVVKTKNGGAAAARYLGGSLAEGKWIAFCDQDDIWHSAKLEKQLRLAHECPELNYILTDYIDYVDVPERQSDIRSHLSYAPKEFWKKEHP